MIGEGYSLTSIPLGSEGVIFLDFNPLPFTDCKIKMANLFSVNRDMNEPYFISKKRPKIFCMKEDYFANEIVQRFAQKYSYVFFSSSLQSTSTNNVNTVN